MSDYGFPVNEDNEVPEDATFRALKPLVGGELAGDLYNVIWAQPGDVFTWYEGARRYPHLVQLMIDRGHVEYVPPKPAARVSKPKVEKADEPKEEIE